MKKRNTHLFTVLLGVLILIAGVRGLMGISSYGFIPHEVYVVFGVVAMGYGLWKFFTAEEDGDDDE